MIRGPTTEVSQEERIYEKLRPIGMLENIQSPNTLKTPLCSVRPPGRA